MVVAVCCCCCCFVVTVGIDRDDDGASQYWFVERFHLRIYPREDPPMLDTTIKIWTMIRMTSHSWWLRRPSHPPYMCYSYLLVLRVVISKASALVEACSKTLLRVVDEWDHSSQHDRTYHVVEISHETRDYPHPQYFDSRKVPRLTTLCWGSLYLRSNVCILFVFTNQSTFHGSR